MEPAETQPNLPEAKPSLSPKVQMVYVAGMFLLLLAIVSWSMTVAGARRAENATKKGVDALSSALVPLLLQRDPAKLKRTLTAVAESGGYREVTVTDPKGYVLASTSALQTSKQVTVTTPPVMEASVRNLEDGPAIERAISLPGENVLGVLIVKPAP